MVKEVDKVVAPAVKAADLVVNLPHRHKHRNQRRNLLLWPCRQKPINRFSRNRLPNRASRHLLPWHHRRPLPWHRQHLRLPRHLPLVRP